MKAKITKVKFIKESDSKFGKLYLFVINWEIGGVQEEGFYRSKKKDQNKFIVGQESEFDVQGNEHNGKVYKNVKPVFTGRPQNSRFAQEQKKEAAKYPSMCISYAKDMLISETVSEVKTTSDMFKMAEKMLSWIEEQDKRGQG